MLKVGLTGNYGMGKSSVAAMFRKLGAVTVDSDEIVAELLKEEPVIARIRALFGVEAMNPDGIPNKKYIAEKVFQHAALRKKLEAILHPLVFARLEARLASLRDKSRIVVVEVPLLFEGGYEGQFDRTIAVYANRKTVLARLGKAGVSRRDALARLKAQMDIRSKMRRADYCVHNNGLKREAEARVRKIYRLLVEESEKKISMDRRRP
jgi:dephospho-CoA kinase